MSDNFHHIKQKAEGSGISQAAGKGSIAISLFGIPIEKLLIGLLGSAILFQGSGYFCSLSSQEPIGLSLCLGTIFPIVFGFPSLFGLIIGIMIKNKKIIILSLLSGALSLLIYGPIILIAVLSN